MKKHSLFKMIGITILVAVLLTWIFPITYFGYELVESPREQFGLFDFAEMGKTTFTYFGSLIFYVLAIGGFYGILGKTNGYRNLLDKIANKFKGKEIWFLSAIIIIFAVIASMAGITTGLLFLFPFVTSIIILMGYNKQTAALTTIGAVAVGLIGTTVSAINTETMVAILGLEFSAGLRNKVIILVVGIALLIFNVWSYSKKHKLAKEEMKEEVDKLPVSNDSKKRTWPIIIIIDFILLIMILASISWESVLGVELFTKIYDKIMAFDIKGFPIFAKIFGEGTFIPFGHWTLYEFIIPIVIGAFFIGFIYRVKFNEMISSFFEGMKKALMPAVLIYLAYFVLVITATRPVLLGIFKPLLTATSGLNVFTMSLVAFVNSIFNMEAYYTTSSVLPYVVTIITDTSTYSLMAIIWQAMMGLSVLIAPTSVILIATLSYLDISFWQWIKASWKFILELLVILLIIFTILVLV